MGKTRDRQRFLPRSAKKSVNFGPVTRKLDIYEFGWTQIDFQNTVYRPLGELSALGSCDAVSSILLFLFGVDSVQGGPKIGTIGQ